jgi:hypothetical protein
MWIFFVVLADSRAHHVSFMKKATPIPMVSKWSGLPMAIGLLVRQESNAPGLPFRTWPSTLNLRKGRKSLASHRIISCTIPLIWWKCHGPDAVIRWCVCWGREFSGNGWFAESVNQRAGLIKIEIFRMNCLNGTNESQFSPKCGIARSQNTCLASIWRCLTPLNWNPFSDEFQSHPVIDPFALEYNDRPQW